MKRGETPHSIKLFISLFVFSFLVLGFSFCKKPNAAFGNNDESPLKNNGATEKAWEIQDSFRQVYDLYKDRVVYISTEQKIQLPYNPFFEMFGNGQREQTRTGLGSGFIISEDGFICTNFHVVAPSGRFVDKITVFIDNVSYKAEIRGFDRKIDIVVLKISPKKKLTPVYIGNSDDVRVGDWAIAIGNPFGLSKSFTVGVVSATGRKDVSEDREAYIQTDAAINPGNSGGPLINIRGEVIGVNRMIYSQSGGYMGIGFAIPINRVKAVLEKLKSGKPVKRGYLGVETSDMTIEAAYSLGWEYDFGVVIVNVTPGGPAAKAGLRNGDIIYQMNGSTVRDMYSLISTIESIQPGETVEFYVWRNGQKVKVNVKVGESPR
jgi:serine protease Do